MDIFDTLILSCSKKYNILSLERSHDAKNRKSISIRIYVYSYVCYAITVLYENIYCLFLLDRPHVWDGPK